MKIKTHTLSLFFCCFRLFQFFGLTRRLRKSVKQGIRLANPSIILTNSEASEAQGAATAALQATTTKIPSIILTFRQWLIAILSITVMGIGLGWAIFSSGLF